MFGSKKKIQKLEQEIEELRKEFKTFSKDLKGILEQMLETDTNVAEKLANQDKLNMMFYEFFDRSIENDTYH